jgi:hypothetical protein
MHYPDFYLASTEGYNMQEPKRCWRIRRIGTDKRDDLLLLKIDPPLLGQRYGLQGRDVDQVLVATRHEGDSLFPITQWPVYVHVARPLVDITGLDKIQSNQLESIAWAELYQTEQDARLKIM